MATKKKSAKPGLSAPKRTTRTVKRIKRRKRKSGMLSEFFGDQSAGKAVLSGAVGGGASIVVDVVAPAQTPVTRGLVKIGLGYVTAKFLGMKNVGAGMAGAGMAQMLSSSFGLSEGGNWAEPIEALPEFMSEDNAMLSETQANAMLSQGYMQTQNPNSYMPNYAPSFANPNY